MPNHPQPPRPPNQPNQQQQEAVKRLSGLFSKEKPYTPLAKSLKAAGIQPRVMDIMLDVNGPEVECLVIPVQELIYKEWKHMTGGIEEPAEAMTIAEAEPEFSIPEREDDGDRSPEVG